MNSDRSGAGLGRPAPPIGYDDRQRHERQDVLAGEYATARNHLVRVAYAVLGTKAEAEDVVSECWQRLVEFDRKEPVRDVTAWATVTVARAALDVLRSARHQRETYVGSWLPEPDLHSLSSEHPAHRVSMDETISYALLVVMESLSPAERVAFVLHDLFGYSFPEVADLVGRSPAAVRQLASRARGHVERRSPRFEVRPSDQRAVVNAFLSASRGGDLSLLVELLDEDVVLTADGGGVVTAARRPVWRRDRVARFVRGTFARVDGGSEIRTVPVNDGYGIALLTEGRVHTVLVITSVVSAVTRIDLVRAPAKLRSVSSALLPADGTRSDDGH